MAVKMKVVIDGWNWMPSDFLEPTSDFQTLGNSLISGQEHKVWVLIFLIRSQGKFGL